MDFYEEYRKTNLISQKIEELKFSIINRINKTLEIDAYDHLMTNKCCISDLTLQIDTIEDNYILYCNHCNKEITKIRNVWRRRK